MGLETDPVWVNIAEHNAGQQHNHIKIKPSKGPLISGWLFISQQESTGSNKNSQNITIITLCPKAFGITRYKVELSMRGDSETVFTIRTIKIKAQNHH